MAFSLKLAKAPQATIDERVGRAASHPRASRPLLDRYPRQLSGGQRQRVAMGRAIVRDPQVFLFDEPLSNLDAKLRVQMRTEIKELHQRLKTTAIYVTHDQIEAMTMADRIVVMQHGVVEQLGAPLELYDRPANLFVAGFIGSPAMNFIDAKVARATAGRWRSPATARSCRCPPDAAGREASRDRLRHPARASAPCASRVGGLAGRGRGGRADRCRDPAGHPARRASSARPCSASGTGSSPASGSGSSRSSIRSTCSTAPPAAA